MIFGSKDLLSEYVSLQTSFRMVTCFNDYVTFDDGDDDVDFRCNYRDTMIAQFKQDF